MFYVGGVFNVLISFIVFFKINYFNNYFKNNK